MTLEYVTGSVPVEQLSITVQDENGNARNLSAYSGATLLVSGPDEIGRTGGTAAISDAANGLVTFTWPEATLFDVPGDYRIALKLTAGSGADYTTPMRVVVVRGLED
ncbi:hypothetical protein [Streptomyces parvulus]|uniref:hypothetical protein n=1 Tax=Streptomyces parvulus TaxID=146923 RepID=UPI0036C78D60